MARPFRFSAPEVRPGSLTRPRLLRVLQQRWEHRVTLVVGGAGLGKTTLLAQALAENRLEPRGTDVWLGIEEADSDGDLGADLLRAVSGSPSGATANATAIADALWARAPTPVSVVLDDVHRLLPGSPGHRLVVDLVEVLPANGYIVLASRSDPAIPMARLAVSGQLQRVTEAELRLTDTELAELAAAHRLDVSVLDGTGGWPAMAELAASAGPGVAGEYVWQEVIEPLEHRQRRVLATLIELGGGDDALLAAALDGPVDLAADLAGVPLIDVDEAGWFRPHDLWQPMARLRLAVGERRAIGSRATRRLNDEGRFEDAFGIVCRFELWEEAPSVLRMSCLGYTRHPSAEQLSRWLQRCPPAVRETAPALFADALCILQVDPDHCVAPLQRAVAAFRADADVDGELAAISQLGRVAWWTRDWDVLVANGERIRTLAAAGSVVAGSLAAIGRAMSADLGGDDAAMAAALSDPAIDATPREWVPVAAWIRAVAAYVRGDVEASMSVCAPHLADSRGTAFHDQISAVYQASGYFAGESDELTRSIGVDATTVVRHNLTLRYADRSRHCSFAGDVAEARHWLQKARVDAAGNRPLAATRVAIAEASLHLAGGDEPQAASTVRAAIAHVGLDRGNARRAWRDSLCLSYMLAPESRDHWHTVAIEGAWLRCRDLCTAIAEGRNGRLDAVAEVELGDLKVARRLLHVRFAAELAVLLAMAGRQEAPELLDGLGAHGRAVTRELAGGVGDTARAARSLLATVPAVPASTVAIGMLGPLTIEHGGVAIDHQALRRERVRALLAYLVIHRRARRTEIARTLWPDLDDRAGANNLRVTLNHLLQVLEPWRQEREPSYLVRTDPAELLLVGDPLLRIDADEFDAGVAAAGLADDSGAPSVALGDYLAAVDRWRGEPFADVEDQPWLDLERERLRAGYVATLQRAAQLLAGRGQPGDLDQADDLARRAIAVDPWAEAAYGVLVSTALGRGNRAAARRMLDRARAVAADLGVEPPDDTRSLARRLAEH